MDRDFMDKNDFIELMMEIIDTVKHNFDDLENSINKENIRTKKSILELLEDQKHKIINDIERIST